MTEPETDKTPDPRQTPGPDRRGAVRGRVLVVAVAAIVAVAGFVAVYGIDGFQGNQNYAGVCKPTKQMADALKPRATGDMASMILAYTPVKVSDLAFETSDGKPTTLKAKQGKVLLVNLWATWCAPCRKEMPALGRLQKDLGGDKFEVVAINLDKRNPAKSRQFLKDVGADNLAYYSDQKNDTFRYFEKNGRARGLPVTMLVDEKGCEIGTLNAPAEWHSEDALDLVRTAIKLAEKS